MPYEAKPKAVMKEPVRPQPAEQEFLQTMEFDLLPSNTLDRLTGADLSLPDIRAVYEEIRSGWNKNYRYLAQLSRALLQIAGVQDRDGEQAETEPEPEDELREFYLRLEFENERYAGSHLPRDDCRRFLDEVHGKHR